MSPLQFPCTIFKTQKWMDNYGASDMRCGDLSAQQLKAEFGLTDISPAVDPWMLTKKQVRHVHPRAYAMVKALSSPEEKITRQECARILFDEFRQLSHLFAVYGPYKHLIEKMITHMQNGNGSPFRDRLLDRALKEHILNDKTENSTLELLKETLSKNIDWKNKYYPAEGKERLRKSILDGKLPKFDRFQDNFNGMGITVHDTWATHITIKSLRTENDRFRAVVHYKVQDHFGLDSNDILKFKFKQFRLFHIWFVLQRCNQFGFKPFMTNTEAAIEMSGGRNESKN